MTHPAERVEAADDLDVPAEIHGGIDLIQRLPPPVGRTVGLVGRRPDEGCRTDALFDDLVLQPEQAVFQEEDAWAFVVELDLGLLAIAE